MFNFKGLILAILSTIVLIPTRAAYPIPQVTHLEQKIVTPLNPIIIESKQNIKSVELKDLNQRSPIRRYGNPHSEDKGVFGILSFIFAMSLMFFLAIPLGIIGMQNGRILKGLAQAGFILGILEALVFIGLLALLILLL